MKVVLGIDAAWSPGNASGVALVAGEPHGPWRCVRSAPSFEAFLGEDACPQCGARDGVEERLLAVLRKAEALAGAPVNVAAVDMPVGAAVTASRAADRQVTSRFGRRRCPAYSPTPTSPGPVADAYWRAFAALGFLHATAAGPAPGPRALLEVYPHTALLSLLRVPCRFEYKVGHSLKFWKGAGVPERIAKVLGQFGRIARALSGAFAGVDFQLPTEAETATLAALKPWEDRLDALVCAWMGVRYLEGGAVPLGDATSAVWCPADVVIDPDAPLADPPGC